MEHWSPGIVRSAHLLLKLGDGQVFQIVPAHEPPWTHRPSPEQHIPEPADSDAQYVYCEMMRIRLRDAPAIVVEYPPGREPSEERGIVLRHFKSSFSKYSIQMSLHKLVLEYSKWAGEGNKESMKEYRDFHGAWKTFLENDDYDDELDDDDNESVDGDHEH